MEKQFKIIISLQIIIIAILGGYLVYDKFITNTSIQKEDYIGYYSGCNKDSEGDNICVELALNEDNTAFLLVNPYSAVAVVGTYSINNSILTIDSTYKLASVNAGVSTEKYNLKLNNGSIVYNFSDVDYKLTQTTKEKLNLYNQMDKGEVALNQTSTSTNTESDIVKKIFVNEYLLNPETEKLLDYRIADIKILSGSQKDEIVNMGYQQSDILAEVSYSVKVNDSSNSIWLAGNGEAIYGNWLLGKSAVVAIRDNKLHNVGTGW